MTRTSTVRSRRVANRLTRVGAGVIAMGGLGAAGAVFLSATASAEAPTMTQQSRDAVVTHWANDAGGAAPGDGTPVHDGISVNSGALNTTAQNPSRTNFSNESPTLSGTLSDIALHGGAPAALALAAAGAVLIDGRVNGRVNGSSTTSTKEG